MQGYQSSFDECVSSPMKGQNIFLAKSASWETVLYKYIVITIFMKMSMNIIVIITIIIVIIIIKVFFTTLYLICK